MHLKTQIYFGNCPLDGEAYRPERANLSGVRNLTLAQLNQACVNEEPKLPQGLIRPKPCAEKETSQRVNQEILAFRLPKL